MADDFKTIEALFDKAGTTILEMNDEILVLRGKFGDTSQLVQKKAAQLATFIALYDGMQQYHAITRSTLILAEVVDHAKDVIIMKHETGLPWDRVCTILGWSPGSARMMMDADERIQEFKITMRELLGDMEGLVKNG